MTGAALTFAVIGQDDSAGLERLLEALAPLLVPGDALVLADLGSSDESPALIRRAAAHGGLFWERDPATVCAALAPGAAGPDEVQGLAAQLRGAPPFILRLMAGEMPDAAGLAALRSALAVAPQTRPALAPRGRWWGECGVALPPGPLPAAGELLLPRGLATDPAWSWSVTDPAGLWRQRQAALALGAVPLGPPPVRAPLPAEPFDIDPDQAISDQDFARALILEALARPPADADPAPLLAAGLAPLLARLAPGDPLAGLSDPAELGRRLLAAALGREAALRTRLSELAAEYDALRPDADGLVRAHSRLVAEVAARRRRGEGP